MIRKAKGQSIIEYTFLAMIVLATVMVMGPYFIRSINAHFKLWQESIDDSINDRMQKVPSNITPPKCTCSGYVNGECGGHFQTSNTTCPVNQRYQYTQCSPPTCGFENGNFLERCVADSTCCSQYNACSNTNPLSSCCGNVPIPNPASPRKPGPSGLLSAVSSPAPNPSVPSTYCYYGEEVQFNQCDPTQIQCKPNDQCKPACVGHLPTNSIGSPTAELCPGADQNLSKDTPMVLLGSCALPPTTPSTPLNCSTPAGTDGLVIKSFKGVSDGTKVSCPSGYLAGYCVKGTGGSDNKNFVTEEGSTADSVTLCEGTHDTSNDFSVDLYCLPCPCGTCTYNPFKGKETSIGQYTGQPTTQPSCGAITPPTTVCPTVPCPDYNATPSPAKCLAVCIDGYKPVIDSSGSVYCAFCQSQTVSDYTNTSAGAGGQRTYTSPVSQTPTSFDVKVFTEDLNFTIQFKDVNGNIIRQELCDETQKASSNNHPNLLGTLNNSCGGRDGDDNIDNYEVTFTANQVVVTVREGGDRGTGSFGYKITANLCQSTPPCASPTVVAMAWDGNAVIMTPTHDDGTYLYFKYTPASACKNNGWCGCNYGYYAKFNKLNGKQVCSTACKYCREGCVGSCNLSEFSSFPNAGTQCAFTGTTQKVTTCAGDSLLNSTKVCQP
jgi:hypothetical protein